MLWNLIIASIYFENRIVIVQRFQRTSPVFYLSAGTLSTHVEGSKITEVQLFKIIIKVKPREGFTPFCVTEKGHLPGRKIGVFHSQQDL